MAFIKHNRLFSETLTTKRATAVGTRRTTPVAYLSGVRSSRVIPLDSTALQEMVARGISVDFQIFCDVVDILAEDRITVESSEYVAVEVTKWPGGSGDVLHITLRQYQV